TSLAMSPLFFMLSLFSFFFFHDTAPTDIYTLSLHDALPIWIEWMALSSREPIGSDAIRRQLPWRTGRPGASRLSKRLSGARRARHRRVRPERARVVRIRQALREPR